LRGSTWRCVCGTFCLASVVTSAPEPGPQGTVSPDIVPGLLVPSEAFTYRDKVRDWLLARGVAPSGVDPGYSPARSATTGAAANRSTGRAAFAVSPLS